MHDIKLFDQTALKSSKIITTSYSTSFSLGIKTLSKKFHYPIYAIYGFVRYADEIVDTFHQYDKKKLLQEFKEDTYKAIKNGISLNPVLHSFQLIVNQYKIELELIDSFLYSMEMDLTERDYSSEDYNQYIYGSAEVVGLMCLKVFCEGDENMFEKLKSPAKSLGSAFQKVNFLRDMKSDFVDRGRVYFPGVDFNNFTHSGKLLIEADIQKDFDHALEGIKKLPPGAKFGVYIAYIYYQELFNKIKLSSVSQVVSERIRIPDNIKIFLLFQSWVKFRFNIV